MQATLHKGHIKQLLSYLWKKGEKPQSVLKGSGLSVQRLYGPELFEVPVDVYYQLQQQALQMGDPGIIAHAASEIAPGNLGSFELLALSVDNVESLLQVICRFSRFLSNYATFKVIKYRNDVALVKEVSIPSETIGQSHAIFCFAQVAAFISAITGNQCRPKEIHLRGSPLPNEVLCSERALRCPVKFFQQTDSLWMKAADVLTPLHTANQSLCATLEQQLRAQVRMLGGRRTWTVLVKELMEWDLQQGHSVEIVAQKLGTSGRQLQRSLQEEGTTFTSLKEEQLKERATQLLREEIPLKTICEELGFSEASSFSRAFKGWVGVSPKKYIRAD